MPLPLIPIIGTVGKLIFDIIDRTSRSNIVL